MATLTDFSKVGNPLYLYDAVLEQMRLNYKNSKPSLLLLNDFFTKKFYQELHEQLIKSERKQNVKADRYSYQELLLSSEITKLFTSTGFLAFLSSVTGKKIRNITLSAQAYKSGDFTLLHDEEISKPGTEFFITFCKQWKPEWGGSTFYTNGEGDPLQFVPIANTLSLITTTKGLNSFVKYLNHKSGTNELIKLCGRIS